MATKDIREMEKEKPDQKLHDLIQNHFVAPLRTICTKLEKSGDIKDTIKYLEMIEHRANGMRYGLEFFVEYNNGDESKDICKKP